MATNNDTAVAILAAHGLRHILILPVHPWTNGRTERVLRLFKEVFSRFWLLAGLRQVDCFCADFVLWHNRDRPHGSSCERTPDEGTTSPRGDVISAPRHSKFPVHRMEASPLSTQQC